MKQYIKLMRCKHYIKNILVFLPLFFSGKMISLNDCVNSILGAIAFCLISSVIYIINDIKDVEADRQHEKKKYRPIASGAVSIKNAVILAAILFLISTAINIVALRENILGYICIYTYFVLNLLYSIKLKHIAIVDIVILASGFLLRVFYGASIINVVVSNWLYLTILAVSFYMGLGKRRNESLKVGGQSRSVLKYYSTSFLTSNMYMFITLAITFYSLWCIDSQIPNVIWTVPLIMILCMQYSRIIEGDSYGDPVEVILENKSMLATAVIYAIIISALIYF